MIAHLLFFLALALPIVVIGAFYQEPEDVPALRSVPRRYAVFVGACALIAGILVLAETLFASV